MATTNWIIDASHSEIQFKVKHLVITTVTGSFNEFSGTVEAGDTFENAKISFEANTASINTNSDQRDGHLKSGDFFDVEKFPKLSFKATKFAKKGDGFELVGDLTIKDVTNSVTLAVEYGGTAKDPWGNTKAGFEVTGKINRKDFGLTWNAPTEAGGVLVSDEVKLIANVQLLKQ
ncbi:YceI family protein [Cytophaga aurantiaca]|uniref:YceI family protein n=1 Tax=Cytophaga aurantiaca TaxID=29530 RepID=UPI00037659A1|nr:YceI family protein [Cytophaga aurantiaca]